MKPLLLSALLLVPTLALAQSTKPDQYCILQVLDRTKGQATMMLQSGSGELAASREQVEDAAKIEAMHYEADALNYLSMRRWEVAGLRYSPGEGARYCLRRHQP